ncbi:MAG: sigma 54-interacting transcriptional regulator [Deltaproteobacteria bacterium]|nr:sigma 54-interacting transcriptional regulator [Deltaproteobacteria bacterium]
MGSKQKVLFLCGGNACRSQMAEGFLRSKKTKDLSVFSAGIRADGLHPLAVKVMHEVNIDISGHTSKSVADLGPQSFDLIITLCNEASAYCKNYEPDSKASETTSRSTEKMPIFVGMPTHLHWAVPDPAEVQGNDQEIIESFRSTRDQIKNKLDSMLDLEYLSSLTNQRALTEKILDTLEDGLLLHDEHRNIFLFNFAAEKITGYSRDEVLGANCHEIFQPGGLCGSKCPLIHGDFESYTGCQYEVPFRTKDGEDRRLMIRSNPVQLLQDGTRGIAATIRDVTEVNKLRFRMNEKHSFHGMVGHSKAMQDVFRIIRQITTSDYPVLITGDSGTGKELVAHAIHNESRRSQGPFVPINCGALPENILESELFGHVRGAFTGAIRDKKGRFELAHKGTIMLDELGELSLAFQVKLLRVLEQKSFEPVGGERTIKVDVRVISATNQDLKKMISAGKFRDDLFYRLSVVPIHLPPLRERKEDLPPLVELILKNIRKESAKEINNVSGEVLDMFLTYNWPGNIRELINILQFASVRCDSKQISAEHLPPEIRNQKSLTSGARISQPDVSEYRPQRRKRLSREMVAQALEEAGGNKVKAAKLLGVGRATLYRFLDKQPVS